MIYIYILQYVGVNVPKDTLYILKMSKKVLLLSMI